MLSRSDVEDFLKKVDAYLSGPRSNLTKGQKFKIRVIGKTTLSVESDHAQGRFRIAPSLR
jgi:hypothetical protein